MTEREKIITQCFHSWIDNNITAFKKSFSDDIVYIESYGPAYTGINQLEKWFTDWNLRGKVIVWDIKKFIHTENTTVCEWYFKCEYDGNIDAFDGISLIDFNNNNKIIKLKEFQCKIPNYYPYLK